jgi:alpha-glucosidase
MLKLRQRLIPYLYTVFEMCHSTGFPILRPLLFEYPEDETTYTADDEFLVGDALLVAPVTRPGIEHRHVYLPRGCWFHYWTGERFDGPAHVLAHAPLGEPPLYVRANTAIPMGPEMSHTGERALDPLTLLLYPSEGADDSTLYEDAGDGFGYESGEYARRNISCEESREHITVRIGEREGSFVPEREELRLELRGFGSAPESVAVNGESVESSYDEESRTVLVPLRESGGALDVEILR